jgi:hypothetical protein
LGEDEAFQAEECWFGLGEIQQVSPAARVGESASQRRIWRVGILGLVMIDPAGFDRGDALYWRCMITVLRQKL